MKIIQSVLIIAGILLFAGMIHQVLLYGRRCIYPSKKVLRQRAVFLGGFAFLMFALAFLAVLLSK